MIQNINDIERIIRNILIEQSQLDAKFVRNSLSLYSTPLDKANENILQSIEQTDSLMLFEVRAREDVLNISEQDEETGIILYYQGYQVHVIIYGDSCRTLAQKVIARLRTARLGDIFRSNDLQCYEVTNPESIQEYVNNTMWLRSDFDINLSCEMEITPTSTDYEFDELTSIDLIVDSGLTVKILNIEGDVLNIEVDDSATSLEIYSNNHLEQEVQILSLPEITLQDDSLFIYLDNRTTNYDLIIDDEVNSNINI